MTVLEVVSQWESTQAVFKRWDPAAGECICCNCLFEPIEYLGKKYRLDTQKLIGELNQAASG
ncbi:MAG: hypothetical protein HUK40_03895 [Desulfobacter sp.]|nr:hypothetical protein [Desulfobacter sp.]WDP87976.1 MAG: hypothetical protein HUN05_08040 [Desulfobacter sp.]